MVIISILEDHQIYSKRFSGHYLPCLQHQDQDYQNEQFPYMTVVCNIYYFTKEK